MNNYPLPIYQINEFNCILNELKIIREEINNINKKLDAINKEKTNKYLKKDDNYYMI